MTDPGGIFYKRKPTPSSGTYDKNGGLRGLFGISPPTTWCSELLSPFTGQQYYNIRMIEVTN